MTVASPLSVAFIERSPGSAAQILENLPAEDAAALVEALPEQIAGLAIEEMAPLSGAQILAQVEPAAAGEIVKAMRFQDAAGVLRMMDEANRDALLDLLSAGLNRDFRKSLSHPRDSVGAWMDRRTSPLVETRSVADALKYAGRKRRPAGDEVFVVDAGRRFAGVVRISELVQKDAQAELKDIITREAPTLSDRATLASIVDAQEWDDFTLLPVVGRRGNFLGTLTRAQTRAGIASLRRRPPGLSPNSLFTHLLSSYMVTVTGLLALFLRAGGRASMSGEIK